MPLNKGKHVVQEINGVLCTVVESEISADRLEFLKELLEFNHFEVKSEELSNEKEHLPRYTIGVTDLVFNPVIRVYENSLKRPNGKTVSPAYWNQEPEIAHLPYFEYRKKDPDAKNEDDFQTNPWAYRTI